MKSGMDVNIVSPCKNNYQKERDCRMKGVEKCKVGLISVGIPGDRWNSGVIWGIPVEFTMEEIKANLKRWETDVCKEHAFREGVTKESKSVLLQFEDDFPKKVALGYMTCNVREYVPKSKEKAGKDSKGSECKTRSHMQKKKMVNLTRVRDAGDMNERLNNKG